MEIKRIMLTNFKNFEGEHTFHFDNINLVQGRNGIGKSTLIKDAILFALYGHGEVSLEKLPTRGKSKSCKVEIHFEDCVIVREYPTKITIVGKDFATNKVAQEWLNEKFQNVDYFKKFRMIDLQQGINILEEGKTSLRKTLFTFNEEAFNKVRSNLQTKKREREVYNRDNLSNISSHFPSKSRLYQLEIGLLNLAEELSSLEKDLRISEQDYFRVLSKKSGFEANKSSFKKQKDKLVINSACPFCERKTNKDTKMKLLAKVNHSIVDLNEKINKEILELDSQKDTLHYLKTLKNKLIERKEKLNILKEKLDNRINLIDYKWNSKDLEIMKQAIRELDGFSSFYITEWIKILEPIMDDIINRIGFNIKFDLDSKGNIDIKLIKNGEEYSYKDLSSGQRLVISIAFQMSLLIERGESGLIVADEGFSSLDETNLHLILELFKNLPFQLSCVIHHIENIPDGVHVINLEN